MKWRLFFHDIKMKSFAVLGIDYPSTNVPVGVHGDWAEKSQKTDFHARVQIKKLTKELEAVKKENEEYAKQAKYFVTGIHDRNHPQNGRSFKHY